MSEIQSVEKKKILLLEDDDSLGRTLSERLALDYSVDWANTIANAQKRLDLIHYDLLILDLNLPDGMGFEIAERNLKESKNIPVVFLTAQADAESRLQGYELGAMEYIPKPFHLKELLMRVKHVLAEHVIEKTVELKTCLINLTNHSITRKNGAIEYPSLTDMKVLKALIESSPRPLSRDEIINLAWGIDKNPSPRSIDNMMVRLRDLLGSVDGNCIHSVRGHGYQWIKE